MNILRKFDGYEVRVCGKIYSKLSLIQVKRFKHLYDLTCLNRIINGRFI